MLALIFQLSSVNAKKLTCANFTGEKNEDCNYITSSDLCENDKDLALNELFEQSYEYYGEIYNPNTEFQVVVPKSEIITFDNKSLVLASKIAFFGLFNYFVFSLTKSNFIIKWLNAV